MRLRGSIGDGGENRREDVVTGKRVFAALGHTVYDRTQAPSPYVDAPLVDAIRDFQRRLGLPVSGLIELDSDELRELGLEIEELENKSGEEFEVAALPLLAILLAGVRLGMAAGRVVARSRAGDRVVKREIRRAERDVQAQTGAVKLRNFINTEEFGGGPIITPVPPPRKPEDNRTPNHHEPPDFSQISPSHPIPDDQLRLPPTFPLPSDPDDFVEVFPDQGGIWSIPTIFELRGSEKTQAYNTEVKEEIERIAKKCGIKIKHEGGARDEHGTGKKEFYLPHWKTGGRIGSNFLDITFKMELYGEEKFLHINTIDTLADGIVETKREGDAAARIINNKQDDDFLVLVQKLREGEKLDKKALKTLIKPILEEMAGRTHKGHKNKRPSPKVPHSMKKGAALSPWYSAA